MAIPGGTEGLSDLGIRRRLARHLRTAGLNSAPPQIPAINRETSRVLRRLTDNINQYQAAINRGNATGYPPELLKELADLVKKVGFELVGQSVPEDEDDEG